MFQYYFHVQDQHREYVNVLHFIGAEVIEGANVSNN